MMSKVTQLFSRSLGYRSIRTVSTNFSQLPKAGTSKGVSQSKKLAEEFQAQKKIVVDFLKDGNMKKLESMKEQLFTEGNVMNKFTFDAHFLSVCLETGSFEMGRDYFKSLHSSGRAGMGAIGRFFVLCHAFRDKCGPSEHELMLKVYDEILKKYGVLDVSTCEAVALGIGLTSRWRTEIPRILAMVEQSDTKPSSSLWVSAVESAFYHGDDSTAWNFMDLYAESGKPISRKLFEVVLKEGYTIYRLLRWVEKHGIILTTDSADVFLRLAPAEGAIPKSSLITRKGFCKACHQTLRPSVLSPQDFEILRSAFLDPVLVGRDIFQKTNPTEVEKFHRFLDQVLPVDVVLDGLNIAYTSKRSSTNGSRLLRYVTSHFMSEGCKILVVGRKHMEKWPARDMDFVRAHASVFLAENLSEDDPFLLYATLKSGIGTRFVSRDRMNGHRFLLCRPHLRRIFSKWQALHQYHPRHISEDGSSVFFQLPAVVAREPQQTSDTGWHLPVVDHTQTNVDGHLQDERAPWLCLQVPVEKQVRT